MGSQVEVILDKSHGEMFSLDRILGLGQFRLVGQFRVHECPALFLNSKSNLETFLIVPINKRFVSNH